MTFENIPFGRHAGRPLPQVALMDPDYFFKMCAEPCPIWPSMEFARQARFLNCAMRSIAPPDRFGACGTHVAYHACRGTFFGVSLVPSQMIDFVVPRGSVVLPYFDLSVARELCPYDREGPRVLVQQMLLAIYGRPRKRTKRFCIDFFMESELILDETDEYEPRLALS